MEDETLKEFKSSMHVRCNRYERIQNVFDGRVYEVYKRGDWKWRETHSYM